MIVIENYHGWSWRVRGIENNGHMDGDGMDFRSESYTTRQKGVRQGWDTGLCSARDKDNDEFRLRRQTFFLR